MNLHVEHLPSPAPRCAIGLLVALTTTPTGHPAASPADDQEVEP